MSTQISRAIRLLMELASGRKLSTQELADAAAVRGSGAVTRRQIQRDLRTLEDAGIPLQCERSGREQRWYVPSSYRSLQPLIISNNEILSLHLLKGALGAFRHTRVHKDIDRLQQKLERLAPGTVFLQEDLVADVSPGRYATAVDDAVMETIVFAITDPHWDRVTYRSIHGGSTKTFVVSFCRLINHAGRVERADDITWPLHVFNEEHYTSGRFGVYDGDVRSIHLRVDASAAEFFTSRSWHPSQQVTRKRDGSIDLRITAPLSPELVSWVVSWSDVLTIVSPAKLKEVCREKTRRFWE
jgi:predicted DNA-binding transcriptional regulator YafY